MPDDEVAAYLTAAQLRAENVQNCPAEAPDALWRSVHRRSAADAPPLLAAVEKVLALAGDLDAEDGYDASDGEALGEVISRGDRIREAITVALLETRMIV